MLTALLFVLAVGVVGFAFVLVRGALTSGTAAPTAESVAVGAAVNFFDTLGIGSFAPTLTWLRLRAKLPDRLIPCTMIVACTLPTMLQAAIFLVLLGVHVDMGLLAAYTVALLAGGLVGQRLVVRVQVWIVQAVVALALVIAAGLYALANLHLMPAGGLATSLPAPLAVTAVAASFVMGVLLNFGIGHYAPSLLMLSLMGMDPKLAFPIMASGGALAAAVISSRHVVAKVADLRIVIGFLLGGVPGVLIAAFVVKDMPVAWLRWLVIVVVLYTAAVVARDAVKAYRQGRSSDPADLAIARAEGLAD
ncbi:MAG TPA: sulfite exporter TauE/SafE family protein [Phenylobacterium sp.]|uniref:sulfite exporter TauE/SafE family protein n=1 Tax=Phenylobacterium sp. TaxID=1871053 RepID=UPI002D625D6C|nr:sulfite exporter TauE/SafE family protein [Phenylobacterium sp.]HZZ69736.1 sulfite exporter TauE/SafE family protein [Phenylobacterium sp.]